MITAVLDNQSQKLYTVNEVAMILGVVAPTINRWYLFKRENPDNEWTKKIPDYITLDKSTKATRYWKEGDIWRLKTFKEQFPTGRNGVMGSVSQRYQPQELQTKRRKEKEKSNGKKKSVKRSRKRGKTNAKDSE